MNSFDWHQDDEGHDNWWRGGEKLNPESWKPTVKIPELGLNSRQVIPEFRVELIKFLGGLKMLNKYPEILDALFAFYSSSNKKFSFSDFSWDFSETWMKETFDAICCYMIEIWVQKVQKWAETLDDDINMQALRKGIDVQNDYWPARTIISNELQKMRTGMAQK